MGSRSPRAPRRHGRVHHRYMGLLLFKRSVLSLPLPLSLSLSLSRFLPLPRAAQAGRSIPLWVDNSPDSALQPSGGLEDQSPDIAGVDFGESGFYAPAARLGGCGAVRCGAVGSRVAVVAREETPRMIFRRLNAANGFANAKAESL